jgi:IS30 family transposase
MPHKMRSDRLVAYVCDRLREGWSPQLISGRLRRDHPRDRELRVCPETIYSWIYCEAQLPRRWMDYLPRAHNKRRRRGGRRVGRSSPAGRTPIDDRPGQADSRAEFGHWEGDSVVGAKNRGGVRTEVERRTRFLMARHVPAITSDAALEAQLDMFTPLPAAARLSTTCDNGPEHARHAELRDRLGTTTYFAHAYHAWERGTNENRNGLIRRYYPKRTDFTHVTPEELQDRINEINNRPMAILGYQTPTEAFQEQLNQLTYP